MDREKLLHLFETELAVHADTRLCLCIFTKYTTNHHYILHVCLTASDLNIKRANETTGQYK